MSEPVEALILDLLEWIGPRPRVYAQVLEAWHTSCPRLPVWEEANVRGFIDHIHEQGKQAHVALSPLGLAHLQALRPYLAFQHRSPMEPKTEREGQVRKRSVFCAASPTTPAGRKSRSHAAA
jgi:hypothetical protein